MPLIDNVFADRGGVHYYTLGNYDYQFEIGSGGGGEGGQHESEGCRDTGECAVMRGGSGGGSGIVEGVSLELTCHSSTFECQGSRKGSGRGFGVGRGSPP